MHHQEFLRNLERASTECCVRQLSEAVNAGLNVAIVHGAGSFGHKQAREYGISKGADGSCGGGAGLLPEQKREGFAKTRLSVTTLNKHVITALVDRGVPAVTISPCPFIGTAGKKLTDGLDEITVSSMRAMLDRGLVPVVHGDAFWTMCRAVPSLVAISGWWKCLAH